jgi:hypothetical protein
MQCQNSKYCPVQCATTCTTIVKFSFHLDQGLKLCVRNDARSKNLYLLSRLSVSVQFVYAGIALFKLLQLFCAMMLALFINFGPAIKTESEQSGDTPLYQKNSEQSLRIYVNFHEFKTTTIQEN